jgi:hypothetical protein
MRRLGPHDGAQLEAMEVQRKRSQNPGTAGAVRRLAPVLTIASVKAGQLEVVGIGAAGYCN